MKLSRLLIAAFLGFLFAAPAVAGGESTVGVTVGAPSFRAVEE